MQYGTVPEIFQNVIQPWSCLHACGNLAPRALKENSSIFEKESPSFHHVIGRELPDHSYLCAPWLTTSRMYESVARRTPQPGNRIHEASFDPRRKSNRRLKPLSTTNFMPPAYAHPCSCERRVPRKSEHAAKPPLSFERSPLLFPAGHIKADVLHQGPEVIQVVLRGGEGGGHGAGGVRVPAANVNWTRVPLSLYEEGQSGAGRLGEKVWSGEGAAVILWFVRIDSRLAQDGTCDAMLGGGRVEFGTGVVQSSTFLCT